VNKYTFAAPCVKLIKVIPTIIVDEALTSKGFEIGDIWFLALKQFIWSLFEDWLDEASAKYIIYSINSLNP